MVSLESRLKTFDNWPPDKQPRPLQLAKCGFYYLGSNDSCVCYYCGIGVNEWQPYENPWVEHATFSGKCPYLRLHKSTKLAFHWNTDKKEDCDNTVFKSAKVKLKT